MKLLVISDLHEKDCWKTRLQDEDWDKVIFLGDYVDSWTHKDEPCINNLKDIIEFKRSMGDNCILLLGNHDIHYMFSPNYRCSGFQQSCAGVLKMIYNQDKDLFQIAHLEGNYLFTHAGVSKAWLSKYSEIYAEFKGNIAERLNSIFNSHYEYILNDVGPASGGMRYDKSGPLWLRPDEDEIIHNYHQVVGHTPIKSITTQKINESTSITYTDVLDKKQEYLLLDI